ncbi:hypothetical protein [Dyella amyloliquefaciens]|uniref:hypothetical protein n=1 Tax=Dyella amyloliquefaciens TaxID=1770545 RepID=UPI00102E2463|nr:hypothetical protein [Dyella amyloliquefaciens]
MKRQILPAVIVLGLAFAGTASAVETYTVDENGYAVIGFVGHSPEDFARAQQQAKGWERDRHLMLVPQSIKAVAIDESQGVALSDEQLKQAIVAASVAKRP